jgi:hypothetical protein
MAHTPLEFPGGIHALLNLQQSNNTVFILMQRVTRNLMK